MTDAQIAALVERLSADEVKPEELAVLPIEEFRKILAHLEQRRQMYMQQYINAMFAARMNLAPDNSSRESTYSESDIVAELRMSELD